MNASDPSKQLRVGVIGAGVFGGFHAGKIATAPDAVLTGIYDPDEKRARGNALKHAAEAFTELNAMFARSDAVIIASPADTHAAMAAAALDAGLHVYVEKPLADTGAEARALAADAARRGLVLQVGHQERFVFAAMGLLNTAERPTSAEAVREGPPSGRGLDTSVTMDLMIHDLDLVRLLFSGEVSDIRASRLAGEPGLADTMQAELTFAGGASVRLKASRVAEARNRTMTLTYPSGTVHIDFVARTFENGSGLSLRVDFADAVPDPLGAAVASFIAACRGEATCPVPGVEAAEAVVLAEAIDRAAG